MAIELEGRKIEISNPGKILFPESGITKGDLIAYYRSVAGWMLPHLKDRPLTLERFPNGIGRSGFYQKNASDYFPDWVRRGWDSPNPRPVGNIDLRRIHTTHRNMSVAALFALRAGKRASFTTPSEGCGTVGGGWTDLAASS